MVTTFDATLKDMGRESHFAHLQRYGIILT
jgi:hypothetical protein